MGSSSSFYAQNATIYTDSNPPGPVDAPLAPTNYKAPSSFYKNTGTVLQSLAEAHFSVAITTPGPTFLTSEWLFGYAFDFPGTFEEDFAGSIASASAAATGSPVFSLLKNGVQFGTIRFTGKVGTFQCDQTNFAIGDLLEMVAPVTPDATLAHLAITLLGTRN